MTLREELYNIARQVRAEEETAKSNAHKIFAEIYLKQQCRIAVAKLLLSPKDKLSTK